ncbi:MAG: CoA transferase [Mesorhizobium sp.]|nr:CoA transferase [Mesorhizobium sp.]MBN9242235.1 CoA transferase [Mesorhizobium sp.]
MTGLLAGIRVLDLTNVLAGPYCAYQLALLGADVIKVEQPGGGDLARQLGASPELNKAHMGASFLAQNAGKRSVALDLKDETDRRRFLDLVASADALVENFRPGVMKRLGLDYEALKAVRPNLVYCAISGFGQSGPMRGNPAYDQIVQGLSGVMSITGTPDAAPLRVGYPVADTLGGLTGAFAIAAALVRQKASGEGAFLDVSMLECTLSALGWPVSNYLTAGVEPGPMGNENMTAAPSGAFAAADGLLNIAANKQEQFVTLCGLIGRPELATDPRFAERETRKQNRFALKALIEAALAGDTAAAWEERLNRAGVPAGRVLTIPQALAEEQVVRRGMTVRFEAVPGSDRPVTVVRGGFLVDGVASAPVRPPPALGQHNREVLDGLVEKTATEDPHE